MDRRKKPVVKVNKITGEMVEPYRSISHAAKCNKWIPYDTIAKMCERKTVGYHAYAFRFSCDYNRHESFENKRVNIPIEISFNGVCRYANNIEDAAAIAGCVRESISKALNCGGVVCGVRVRRLRFMGDICPNREKVILEG